MTINRDAIDAYKILLQYPHQHHLDLTPIQDYFVKSDKVTSREELADKYIQHVGKPLPKPILYVIMYELFGACAANDEQNNLGYYLIVNPLLGNQDLA